jgi:hypothetical protein
MSQEFINLHRQIMEHWIWKDSNKLKWWLDILLTVNTQTKKVNLGNEVFVCERGQCLLSLQGWASRWGVSKDTARNFLTSLEASHMITRVINTQTTLITVCNYDSYNDANRVQRTVAVRSPAPTNIYKDNILFRKEKFKDELRNFGERNPSFDKENLNEFFKYWTELNPKRTRMRFELEKTWELPLRVANWIRNAKQPKKFFATPVTGEVGN